MHGPIVDVFTFGENLGIDLLIDGQSIPNNVLGGHCRGLVGKIGKNLKIGQANDM